MKFESMVEFLEYFEEQRKQLKNDCNLDDIREVAWYKIPLFDSIVSEKIMEEYLLRNCYNGITKSFIVVKHRKDKEVWLVEQYQKAQEDIDEILNEFDLKMQARLEQINAKIKERGLSPLS